MAGDGWLIGIGHDLQRIADVDHAHALREPGVFFTAGESVAIAARARPAETRAGHFAAKEALFKSLGGRLEAYWTDLEVVHDTRGAPSFRLHGAVRALFEERRWRAAVSISHSGEYASAFVVVSVGDPVDIGSDESRA